MVRKVFMPCYLSNQLERVDLDTWTADATYAMPANSPAQNILVGYYVYSVHLLSPGRVTQFNIITREFDGNLVLSRNNAHAICTDNAGNLYIGTLNVPGNVIKVTYPNMVEDPTIVDYVAGEGAVQRIIYHNGKVYAGVGTTRGITRIDAATMVREATLLPVGITTQPIGLHVAGDGYLYCIATDGGTVRDAFIRIDLTTFTESARLDLGGNYAERDWIEINGKAWIITSDNPTRVLRVDLATMTLEYSAAPVAASQAADFLIRDAQYLYWNNDTSPGQIIRFDPATLTGNVLALPAGVNRPFDVNAQWSGRLNEEPAFKFFDAPPVITPGAGLGAWATVDLSAYVPVGCPGVWLRVYNNSGANQSFGVRMNGSTDNFVRAHGAPTADVQYAAVGLDSNRQFQIWLTHLSQSVELIAYASRSCEFQTNLPNVCPAHGAWNDATVVKPGYRGAIFMLDVQLIGANATCGARKNGSADARTTGKFAAAGATTNLAWAICGLDTAGIAELYSGALAANNHWYLVAWIKDGCFFYTTGIDKSIGAIVAWTDVDCSAQALYNPLGVFMEIMGSGTFGMRRNPGLDAGLYPQNPRSHLLMGPVAVDSSAIFEEQISAVTSDIWLIGWVPDWRLAKAGLNSKMQGMLTTS